MKAIYFDTETGGLHDDAPVIQLAAVAVDESTWAELGSFERKILFDENTADPEALKLNHYDADVWKQHGVSVPAALREFSAFVEPHKSIQFVSKRTGNPYSVAKLVGHNAATFDGPRLKRLYEFNRLFMPFDPRVRCTVQAAMFWFDCRGIQPPSFKLTDLCKYFGLPVADDAHDALADVRMTVALARRLRDSALPGQVAA